MRNLKSGDHFGDLALINNVRRTLSVRVSSKKAKVLALCRSTFYRILGDISIYLKRDYEGVFDKEFKAARNADTEEAKITIITKKRETNSLVKDGNRLDQVTEEEE